MQKQWRQVRGSFVWKIGYHYTGTAEKKQSILQKSPDAFAPGEKVLLRLQRAVGSGGLRGQTGVVVDELDVGGEAVAAGSGP